MGLKVPDDLSTSARRQRTTTHHQPQMTAVVQDAAKSARSVRGASALIERRKQAEWNAAFCDEV